MSKKTDIIIGKNDVVSVGVKTEEEHSVVIRDLDPMEISFEGYPEYTGSTTVTPSQSRQVLPTAGRTLSDNITVEPIPNNYGLISWNGSTLSVS